MKHIKLLIIVAITAISVINTSCNFFNNDKSAHVKIEKITERPDARNTDFIYIEDGKFKHRDSIFTPLMLNYVVSHKNIDGKFVIYPNNAYVDGNADEILSVEDANKKLRSHFRLIRDLGFNTLRICFDRVSTNKEGHKYYWSTGGDFYIKDNTPEILKGLEEMINLAKEEDLRIMLLLPRSVKNLELENFNIAICKNFSESPTIFAYDFFNEPLYFDSTFNYLKAEAFEITNRWKDISYNFAPYQLYTIGLAEPIEVFKFDPSIIPFDFICFHAYNPLYVKNEIYWYSQYIDKPWMIGETGLSCDNKHIPYSHQKQFMEETLQYVKDCGGLGYAWWDFQDIIGPNDDIFDLQSHNGILNRIGTTSTKDGEFTIRGSLKQDYNSIKTFSELKAKPVERPVNYFNITGYNNFLITGRVLDSETKQPIEGAVIRGWNQWWSIGLNTFTDEDGRFCIYSNDICVNFVFSAPGMNSRKLNKSLSYFDDYGNKYKDNGELLPYQYLENQDISYLSFMKNADTQNDSIEISIFDYDAEVFNKYKFKSDIGDIYLEKFIAK